MPSDIHAAMAAAGLKPVKPIDLPDGKLVRFRVRGDKAGSSNGWVVLHSHPVSAGAFGSWRTGESHTWRDDAAVSLLTPEQRRAAAEALRERDRLRNEEQARVRETARKRAARLWSAAHPATDSHPYLQAKKVAAFGIRQLRNMLVVPVRDGAGKLHTLQFIGEDGAKRFLSGGRIAGCYFAVAGARDDLMICEGYATGATVRQASGSSVAVAFNAGNLEPVARALRAKFPRVRITICADNDHGTPGNPGLTAAMRAADAIGAAVAVPDFRRVSRNG